MEFYSCVNWILFDAATTYCTVYGVDVSANDGVVTKVIT